MYTVEETAVNPEMVPTVLPLASFAVMSPSANVVDGDESVTVMIAVSSLASVVALDVIATVGAVVLTLLCGVVGEWIQYYNPLRSFDAWDWIADGAGSITAIWVYRNWRFYRRTLETRVSDLCRLKLTEID